MLHDNKEGATLHIALGVWQSLYSAKHRVCAAQESAPHFSQVNVGGRLSISRKV